MHHLLTSLLTPPAGRDGFKVIQALHRLPAREAAEVYDQAQRDAYWKLKDVPRLVAISRAGIQHALTAAGSCVDGDEQRHLLGAAKTLAYNLASFTWPGWNEAGILLTAVDVATGLDAARLNVRLAGELNRPAQVTAKAFWLLGAHELAVPDYVAAIATFSRGREIAIESPDIPVQAMLHGYEALARMLDAPRNAELQTAFAEQIASLRRAGTEDAISYAQQLETAQLVFRQ